MQPLREQLPTDPKYTLPRQLVAGSWRLRKAARIRVTPTATIPSIRTLLPPKAKNTFLSTCKVSPISGYWTVDIIVMIMIMKTRPQNQPNQMSRLIVNNWSKSNFQRWSLSTPREQEISQKKMTVTLDSSSSPILVRTGIIQQRIQRSRSGKREAVRCYCRGVQRWLSPKHLEQLKPKATLWSLASIAKTNNSFHRLDNKWRVWIVGVSPLRLW